MNRMSTAKEALIAEALGDMAGLIDRLEKLAPVLLENFGFRADEIRELVAAGVVGNDSAA